MKKYQIRDCQKLSLNSDSNVNWGFAVGVYSPLLDDSNVNWGFAVGVYSPLLDDYEDIAWFNSKSRALGYVKLLKELAGE